MPIYTEEVTHSSHPNHVLKPQINETPYKCDGCKETGWGLRFSCDFKDCDYHLHKDCAYAKDPITHPFYGRCNFKFRNRGFVGTFCTACGKEARGFHYDGGKYKLHPVCANLRSVLEFEEGELHLQECVHTTKCCKCGKRNLFGRGEKGWSYRSTCKQHHIHVACLKDMVKDLAVKKWEEKQFCGNVEIFSVPDLLETFETLRGSSRSMNNRSSRIAAGILNLVLSIILGIPSGVFNFLVFED